MAKMYIKKGDIVAILAGKDYKRGEVTTGEVLKVLTEDNKVIVSGINVVKKHVKPNAQNPQGGIVEKEAPIHASNVALIDPVSKKPTRVGYKIEDGKKVRISKSSGKAV